MLGQGFVFVFLVNLMENVVWDFFCVFKGAKKDNLSLKSLRFESFFVVFFLLSLIKYLN